MELKPYLEKLEKAPWIVARKAFWSCLLLIGLAVIIGLLLGYNYVYLVQRTQPEAPTLTHLNQNKLQEVLNLLEERKSKFERVEPPAYNLFEAD